VLFHIGTYVSYLNTDEAHGMTDPDDNAPPNTAEETGNPLDVVVLANGNIVVINTSDYLETGIQNPYLGSVVWMYSNGQEYQHVLGIGASNNGIEVDSSGNLYVAQVKSGTQPGRIVKVTTSAQQVLSYGNYLSAPGGMTIFHNGGGSGNAPPPLSHPLASLRLSEAQASNLMAGATALTADSSGLMPDPLLVPPQPLAIAVTAQAAATPSEPMARHNHTLHRTVVEALFADRDNGTAEADLFDRLGGEAIAQPA